MDQVTTYAGVGTADLSADTTDDDEPALIHGIALGEGDVTYGGSEKRKYWSAEALQMMEGTLTGQELVVAHENSPTGTVGTVTKDTYEPGVGILYEAEIAPHYEQYAEDVKAGLLEVSPRIYHPETAQLDRHEETGAWYVDQAHADNLSLVRDGASPSNTAEFGEAEAFAAGPMDSAVAVLSQGSPRPDDADVVESLADQGRTESVGTNLNAPEWTEGMFVEWQVNPDMIGQIVHVDETKDIVMVDVHEREGDRLTSTGYTVSAGYSDIQTLRTQMDARDAEMDSSDDEMESEEMEEDSEEFDESTKTALKNKVEEHNDKHGDEEGKRVTYTMLKNVYEKGIGAYNDTKGRDMSPNQWAMARVNAFLYLVRNEKPENDDYIQDNGLLPDGHPKKSEVSENASADTALLTGYENEELASDEMDENLDSVYSEWDSAVNMTASELKDWASNPCAQEASVEPKDVISRNLKLLETNKSDWTDEHMEDAKRTISFIERMRPNEPDGDAMDGAHGCPTEWAISLLNWAYNPFDSMPSAPDEGDLSDADGYNAEELSVTSGDTPSGGSGPAETDSETEVDELAPSYSVHEPEYDGTHTDDWEKPTLSEFLAERDLDAESWDDLDEEAQMSIAAHFFLVDGDWPGSTFGDLKLPVVEPDGRLSKSALETVLTGRGVQAVEGVSDEVESEVLDMVDDLMGEFEDGEADAESDEEAEEMQVGTVATVVSDDSNLATAELGVGEKPHSISQMHQIEYDSANGEEIEELSEPVVVERDALDSVRDDAEQAEELSNELGDLRDDVAELSDARAVVEELSEADRELLQETDATVVESEELEAKEEAIEEVAGIYAEELSEHSPFEAEELTDRFSPVELRERVENHETAELSSTVTETDPEPDAGSVESEELENGRTEAELEEIEEQAREEVATLYEQEIGWDEQADKIRSGDIALEELGVDVEEYAE